MNSLRLVIGGAVRRQAARQLLQPSRLLPVAQYQARWNGTQSTADGAAKPEADASNKQETAPAKSAREQELEKTVAESKEKIKELTDGYLRALAEMENVREQKRRDVEAARQFALQKFAKDVVEIPELLKTALSSVPVALREKPEDPKWSDFYKGVSMVRDVFVKTLTRHGVSEIETIDKKFDPNLHEAVFEVPDADKVPGTVAVCIKEGYSLNGRTIKAAQVGVTRKP